MKYKNKKSKDAFVIIERMHPSNVILDICVADSYPEAHMNLENRFEQERATARIIMNSPETTDEPCVPPYWMNENKFIFSTGKNKKSCEIIKAAKI